MAETVSIDASRAAPSLWDRVSSWVSENKAVAYTIAGTVVVITSAGAIYYFSGQSKAASLSSEKKKSKKERRKEKKAAEEAQKAGVGIKDEEAGSCISSKEQILKTRLTQHRRCAETPNRRNRR